MNSESRRGVPVYSQKTMELALQDVEKLRAGIPKQRREEGRPEEIVEAHPAISASSLLERFRARQFEGVIEDIEDGKVWFIDAPGVGRSASIAGLKDRLRRARKSVSSRKPVSANA